jgi:hypothetical protein
MSGRGCFAIWCLTLTTLMLVGCTESPETLVEDATEIAWTGTAAMFDRAGAGPTHRVRCPAGGQPAIVWGHDVYTVDSSICTAAAHAGFLTLEHGGVVTLELIGPRRLYGASIRNGITSYAYGAFGRSFVFLVGGRPLAIDGSDATPIAWNTQASGFGPPGERHLVSCPPEGTAGFVWGHDAYTTDSSVCTAGVHVGQISLEGGGELTVQMAPGRRLYGGSRRNGVTTFAFGPTGGSFVLSKEGSARTSAGSTPVLWETTGSILSDDGPVDVRLLCPATGAPAAVWGTDRYSSDSSLCTAAVHAGVIDLDSGGPITVRLEEGAVYEGSLRNGVRSLSYGRTNRSVTFVR